MDNIKFHRAKQLPSNPTSADDGLWYVKPDGADEFEIYMIKNGGVTIFKGSKAQDQLDCGIGGRNLIVQDQTINRYNDGTIIVDGYHLSVPSSTQEMFYYLVKVDPNTNYTITYDGAAYKSMLRYSEYSSKPTAWDDGSIRQEANFQSGTTFKTGSTATWVCLGIYGKEIVSYPAIIQYFKLEKGCTATDWTPSPKDQVTDYNETDADSFAYLKGREDIASQDWVQGQGYLKKQNNLSGLGSKSAARTNLGLGSAATKAEGYFAKPGDIPTNNSDLTNGAGYLTSNDLSSDLQVNTVVLSAQDIVNYTDPITLVSGVSGKIINFDHALLRLKPSSNFNDITKSSQLIIDGEAQSVVLANITDTNEEGVIRKLSHDNGNGTGISAGSDLELKIIDLNTLPTSGMGDVTFKVFYRLIDYF